MSASPENGACPSLCWLLASHFSLGGCFIVPSSTCRRLKVFAETVRVAVVSGGGGGGGGDDDDDDDDDDDNVWRGERVFAISLSFPFSVIPLSLPPPRVLLLALVRFSSPHATTVPVDAAVNFIVTCRTSLQSSPLHSHMRRCHGTLAPYSHNCCCLLSCNRRVSGVVIVA
ncbi:hypothetical protein O3P69_018352 [Scylla paramamosain]|uniref:Secreted protein n=1 Tax=Scylla paramamosain TaxID=85552 RepID=A0AAW0SDZ6_SCYPA